ncbi:Uncharacterised protein [Enterobacter cloacae]|nr:Uncharacterised protein [Enterobacter cloacae]
MRSPVDIKIHAPRIGPGSDTLLRQFAPRKQWPRIVFTLRGDIRVCHHVLRFNVVAGDDVSGKRDQRRNLPRFEGGKGFHVTGFPPAAVFQLNADGGIIYAVGATPEADARMPGQFALRDQLPDTRFALRSWRLCGDEIVRADVFIGQGRKRGVEIIGGVVNNQHLYTRVGRLRLMARIQLVRAFINNALFRGASCQQHRQQEG